MFITFEGIDGVGKSTQSVEFARRVGNQIGHSRVVLTHEPGGTDFGMRVRQIIKSEPTLSVKSQFHLIEAQRAHHVDKVLVPNISQGNVVICDRFIDTSYVYQNSFMTSAEWVNYLTTYPIIPDFTFFLWSADIPSLKTRMAQRSGVEMDHFDNASIEKLSKMQQHFFTLMNWFPRIVAINTDRSEEEVADAIWSEYKIY
jgi:dTMP kinase